MSDQPEENQPSTPPPPTPAGSGGGPPPPPPPPASDPSPGPSTSGAVERLPLGAGSVSASDDKLYCVLCQFLSLIIWLWKKDESPAVNLSGKEALNFHITAGIGLFGMTLVNTIPILGWCIFAPMFGILWLAVVVLCVIGALKTSDGYFYKYPINLRLIK